MDHRIKWCTVQALKALADSVRDVRGADKRDIERVREYIAAIEALMEFEGRCDE